MVAAIELFHTEIASPASRRAPASVSARFSDDSSGRLCGLWEAATPGDQPEML